LSSLDFHVGPAAAEFTPAVVLAQLEKRSVSNLIEIMAADRWQALAEREGIDYAKTVAELAGLKRLNANKEADRKKFRREIRE
jgi:hypothetical protein